MNAPPPPQPPDDQDDPVAMAHYQNLLKQYHADSLRRSRAAATTQLHASPAITLKPHEMLDAVDGNTENIGASSASNTMEIGVAAADDDDLEEAPSNDQEEEDADALEESQKSTTARGKNFCSEEYLLLAKAYMQHSNDATKGTDQTSGHFWRKVSVSYNQFINQSNSVNSSRENYSPLPERTTESLKGAWGRRLQKAVGKFAGIVQTNPPSSGEKKDDQQMDLYYSRMRELYAERVKKMKNMPKRFGDMMAAYLYLSTHDKFKSHFPDNEEPRSLRKVSKASLQAPLAAARPEGRDKSKKVKQAEVVFNKMRTEIQSMSQTSSSTNEQMMKELVGNIKQANETMNVMQKHQVMSLAPSPMKKKYFDDVYAANIMEANTKKQRLELEQLRLDIEKEELTVKKMELDNRKRAAQAEAAETTLPMLPNKLTLPNPECCYPDCKQTIPGNVDKCGNDSCDHELTFHHCCQIEYLARYDTEVSGKRCYECASDIVMGLDR